MDHRVADREEEARRQLRRPAAVRDDGCRGEDRCRAEGDGQAALHQRRGVGAGQIEPGRVQEMVVVVVDAPQDLVDRGQPADEIEAPYLVEPEVARGGEQPKHRAPARTSAAMTVHAADWPCKESVCCRPVDGRASLDIARSRNRRWRGGLVGLPAPA